MSDHQSAQRPQRTKSTPDHQQHVTPDVGIESQPAFDLLQRQPLTPKAVLALQASHGNAYVNRLLQRSGQVSLRAGRLIIQRRKLDLAEENTPEKSCKKTGQPDANLMKTYVTKTFWPKSRSLTDWIAKLRENGVGEDVIEKWNAYLGKVDTNVGVAFRNLSLTVERLKSHLESTYLSELTEKEIDEKKRMIRDLIKALQPSDLGVDTLLDYKQTLKNKVLNSPRYMRSIKGKLPYVEHEQDDDASTTGYNARLIDELCDEIRGGRKFYTDEAPGTDTDWSKWRENDCLFAGIAAVLMGKDRPTDETEDEAKATIIANKLNLKHGPVSDPVILTVMEKLGWTYQSGLTWTTFQQNADTTKTYIISFDTEVSGGKSHVVVAGYNNRDSKWAIYDRQGVRLSRTQSPKFANNPMDAWLVANSDMAKEIRKALKE